MLLTGDYSTSKGLDNTTVPFAHAANDGPPFFQWQMKPGDPYYVDPLHPADQIDNTFKTVSLKVDYDFGWSVATLIPAYSHSSRWVVTDLISGLSNGPAPPKTSLGDGNTTVEDQYTVEARLASPEKSMMKWVVGAYYLTTKNQPSTQQAAATTYFETYGNNRPADSVAVPK